VGEHPDQHGDGTQEENGAGKSHRKLQQKRAHGITPGKLPPGQTAALAQSPLPGQCDANAQNHIFRLGGLTSDWSQGSKSTKHAALGLKFAGTIGATFQMRGDALHLAASKPAVEVFSKAGSRSRAADGMD
jgi:hypothetical protein